MSILVLEHDADLLNLVTFLLRRDGHDVVAAHDGAAGLHLWEMKDPRLVLLEADLPKLTGWEACKHIRRAGETPIIMVGESAHDDQVVRAFEYGADDFITKPFSPRQLTARIHALLRRVRESADQPRKGWQTITAGDLHLDPQWRNAGRGGDEMHLTATEFKLLYELVLHEGQVLTHAILTDRVWGYEGVDDASLIKGHIRNLRRKLEPDAAHPTYVQTVPGIGYTFGRRAAGPPSMEGTDPR